MTTTSHLTATSEFTRPRVEMLACAADLSGVFGTSAFTAAEAVEAGWTRDALSRAAASGAIQRVARGIYCVVESPEAFAHHHIDRLRRAGIPATVGALTAGTSWGIPAVGSSRSVEASELELLVPPTARVRIGARHGVRIRHADLGDGEVFHAPWLGGLPITSPLRTGLDVARAHGRCRASALIPLSMGVRVEIALRVHPDWSDSPPTTWISHEVTRVASRESVRREVCADLGRLAERVNAHGMRWVRRVLPDVEPLLESALEGLAWAHLTDSTIPRPRPQEWVRGASGRRYRADFLIGNRVILECDGAVKYVDQTPWQEKQRQSDLEAAGYWVVRCTWEELIHRPHEVIARIVRALLRAA